MFRPLAWASWARVEVISYSSSLFCPQDLADPPGSKDKRWGCSMWLGKSAFLPQARQEKQLELKKMKQMRMDPWPRMWGRGKELKKRFSFAWSCCFTPQTFAVPSLAGLKAHGLQAMTCNSHEPVFPTAHLHPITTISGELGRNPQVHWGPGTGILFTSQMRVSDLALLYLPRHRSCHVHLEFLLGCVRAHWQLRSQT